MFSHSGQAANRSLWRDPFNGWEHPQSRALLDVWSGNGSLSLGRQTEAMYALCSMPAESLFIDHIVLPGQHSWAEAEVACAAQGLEMASGATHLHRQSIAAALDKHFKASMKSAGVWFSRAAQVITAGNPQDWLPTGDTLLPAPPVGADCTTMQFVQTHENASSNAHHVAKAPTQQDTALCHSLQVAVCQAGGKGREHFRPEGGCPLGWTYNPMAASCTKVAAVNVTRVEAAGACWAVGGGLFDWGGTAGRFALVQGGHVRSNGSVPYNETWWSARPKQHSCNGAADDVPRRGGALCERVVTDARLQQADRPPQPCPAGWAALNARCVYVSTWGSPGMGDVRATLPEARRQCLAMGGGGLLQLDTEEWRALLLLLVQAQGSAPMESFRIWVGNTSTNATSAVIFGGGPGGLQVVAAHAWERLPFACAIDTQAICAEFGRNPVYHYFQGRCYGLETNSSKEFLEVEGRCVARGGHSAALDTPGKRDFVQQLNLSDSDFWMGLYDTALLIDNVSDTLRFTSGVVWPREPELLQSTGHWANETRTTELCSVWRPAGYLATQACGSLEVPSVLCETTPVPGLLEMGGVQPQGANGSMQHQGSVLVPFGGDVSVAGAEAMCLGSFGGGMRATVPTGSRALGLWSELGSVKTRAPYVTAACNKTGFWLDYTRSVSGGWLDRLGRAPAADTMDALHASTAAGWTTFSPVEAFALEGDVEPVLQAVACTAALCEYPLVPPCPAGWHFRAEASAEGGAAHGCYYTVGTNLTASSALAACRALHPSAHLLEINSPREQADFENSQYLNKHTYMSRAWLGLARTDRFSVQFVTATGGARVRLPGS